MNRRILIALAAAAAIIIVGVWSVSRRATPTPPSAGKPTVAASFYPLYFFAHEIAGTDATVTNITPAGTEPHEYEPTSQELARLESAQLVIVNGGGLEPWGDDVVSTLDPKETTVVIAGAGLTDRTVAEEGKTVSDPHVWLSPPLARTVASRILEGFLAADPAHADDYRTNATLLDAKLATLDAEFRNGLSSCRLRSIVTSHEAFGYLAAAYGFEQIGISGLTPDAEPTAQDLVRISSFVKERHIKYIFFESLASPKLAETLARETGAKTLVLDPLEGLTADRLNAGDDYFSVMRANLVNLTLAMQCATP